MHFSFVYIVLLGLATLMLLFFAFYSWLKIKSTASSSFQALLLSFAIYTFGYIMQLLSGNLADIGFWVRIQYLGIPLVGPFWLIMTARLSGSDKWLKHPFEITLFIIPALTLFLNWTNDWHHLYYTHLAIRETQPFMTLNIGHGPWYWVHQIYHNLCIFTGIIFLVKMIAHSPKAFRLQIWVLLLASLSPWVGYMIYLTGNSPYHLDLTALFLVIWAPVFFIAVTRFKVIDLVPVARDIVFEHMKECVIVVDQQNRLVDFNAAVAATFSGLSPRDIGSNIESVFLQYPEIVHVLNQPQENRRLRIDKNGETIFYQYSMTEMKNSHNRPIGKTLILMDISEQVRLMESLQKLAAYDELTQLYNRHSLIELGMQELEHAVVAQHPFSLMELDLDHFKEINDTYGHAAGDDVLKALAAVFRECLRKTDIAGRYGGEEFIIILPETDQSSAWLIAERIRQRFEKQEIHFGKQIIRVTASIGLTSYHRVNHETLEEIIRIADLRLYLAKEHGRNRVCVSDRL